MKPLKTAIGNQSTAEKKNEQVPNTISDCQAILGSKNSVDKWRNFYNTERENIEVLAAAKLKNFCEQNNFTKEQYTAYRLGLAEFPAFLEECSQE